MITCYLRPLILRDAQTSFHWRNNPDIWKYTGARPDKEITAEIENNWLRNVLQKEDEQRYAICIEGSNEYIGNAQLTSIKNGTAEFHIFIGDPLFWGKGIGRQATKLIIECGKKMGLSSIYLWVNSENAAAIKAYEYAGFTREDSINHELKMTISLD